MMKYLVLGATGMAGHVIALYLISKGHEVFTLSRNSIELGSNIIRDIKDTQKVKNLILSHSFDCVINAVGILNQSAEDFPAEAVFINSYIPHYLTDVTKNSKTKIIHMSTDCVFSGLKGDYTEYDAKDGLTMYDRSKALGEIENDKDLTIRTTIIGPDMKTDGIGLFNWFMKQDNPIIGFSEVYWSGVTTLILAKAIEVYSNSSLSGIIHLTNNKKISKFELLSMFNQIFRSSQLKINPHSEKKLDKSLRSTRHDTDFIVPGYKIMLEEMRNWIIEHKQYYPHYEM